MPLLWVYHRLSSFSWKMLVQKNLTLIFIFMTRLNCVYAKRRLYWGVIKSTKQLHGPVRWRNGTNVRSRRNNTILGAHARFENSKCCGAALHCFCCTWPSRRILVSCVIRVRRTRTQIKKNVGIPLASGVWYWGQKTGRAMLYISYTRTHILLC
jgi:hypothetical protein